MLRAQIMFEERQYEQIRAMAHRKRISIAEAVRRLVTLGLRNGRNEEIGPQAKALLAIAGIGKSGLRDLGRRHDKYLAEDLKK